jgi:hypothetical protein
MGFSPRGTTGSMGTAGDTKMFGHTVEAVPESAPCVRLTTGPRRLSLPAFFL